MKSISRTKGNIAQQLLAKMALVIMASVILSSAAFASHKPRPRNQARPKPNTRPIELRNIEQLRAIFQRDDDKVRMVVLVSPT